MDHPMESGAVPRMLSAFSGTNAVYRLAIAVLLAGLLYRWSFRPKTYTTFPVWAAIEIALTSLIVSKGGISRRL